MTTASAFLNRAEAAEYVQSHGLPLARGTLQKHASAGGGPRFHKFGQRCVYRREDLHVWTATKLGRPVISSNGGETAADDRHTEGNPHLTHARTAAAGSLLAVPRFRRPGAQDTDFNDLARSEGLAAVQLQFQRPERVERVATGLSVIAADRLPPEPIVSAVAGDSHRNAEVRRGLQPLVDLAAAVRCVVLGISHFTKSTAGRDPVERVTGSLAFGALDGMELKRPLPIEGIPERTLCRAASALGVDRTAQGFG